MTAVRTLLMRQKSIDHFVIVTFINDLQTLAPV
jgi:hypothetical protein